MSNNPLSSHEGLPEVMRALKSAMYLFVNTSQPADGYEHWNAAKEAMYNALEDMSSPVVPLAERKDVDSSLESGFRAGVEWTGVTVEPQLVQCAAREYGEHGHTWIPFKSPVVPLEERHER